jgi:hypothetical protein
MQKLRIDYKIFIYMHSVCNFQYTETITWMRMKQMQCIVRKWNEKEKSGTFSLQNSNEE